MINNSSTIKKRQWIKISKLKKLVDLYVVGFEVIKDGWILLFFDKKIVKCTHLPLNKNGL